MDGTGLEHLTLPMESEQIIARSVVIGQRAGCPYGVRYRIVCDAGWVIHTLDLENDGGPDSVSRQRWRWPLDGSERRSLA
jgi:hypothetical protein